MPKKSVDPDPGYSRVHSCSALVVSTAKIYSSTASTSSDEDALHLLKQSTSKIDALVSINLM